ncbi:hypothetical protein [Lacticaseibacillus mingshuiensis]|uniref:Uncharacterized protein n=1 Tax=Lacticaseibacillus mingshuiensis TaxID=2799574 RepID=A0ABW4CIN6_9LACO|nr:hypothetical protein [Lacticaseibacillus mingshuiensis]
MKKTFRSRNIQGVFVGLAAANTVLIVGHLQINVVWQALIIAIVVYLAARVVTFLGKTAD